MYNRNVTYGLINHREFAVSGGTASFCQFPLISAIFRELMQVIANENILQVLPSLREILAPYTKIL